MRILRAITIKKASSRRSLMSLCYKTISSCCSCAYVEILSTWEVWRALKRLELHSAAPRATLTPLSCSPNFPRAQYLDLRTLMHELIVNCMMASFHYHDQNAVSGLCCQANFSNCLFIPKGEDKFEIFISL